MAQKSGNHALAFLFILLLFLFVYGVLVTVYGARSHRRSPGLANPGQAVLTGSRRAG